MGTYTVGSPQHQAAIERAEQEIAADLKAGAVEAYIDGESAQQYLGEILLINSRRREPGESLKDWMARIASALDFFITKIITETAERCAEENAK